MTRRIAWAMPTTVVVAGNDGDDGLRYPLDYFSRSNTLYSKAPPCNTLYVDLAPRERKRRKPEERSSGKMVSSRKDKLVESSSKMNMPSSLPQTMAAYPPMMHHLDQNERMPSEGICGTTMHLLKQNAQTLSQISSNLSAYKLPDYIDLFCQARNNITAMLNNMRDTPGLMSHMPPLPVSVNEDLANSILPGGWSN
ncbi:ZZ-type zinc finger-containing protein 3, putative isoform 4 [Hibiscus syriacus]|uniref:ZZ-type zinc finger-containing protein 3, putative isoform 4 n=1 Tax=Hibiscus syriacus TaxID=106335 RepID=A0A6A2Y7Y8_HIBSY|nr:ZZ-type zinc finger-containing protein 3, putative isoform 4 [Hibiscus syriacus]